jgi:hypothetical protein
MKKANILFRFLFWLIEVKKNFSSYVLTQLEICRRNKEFENYLSQIKKGQKPLITGILPQEIFDQIKNLTDDKAYLEALKTRIAT